MPEADPAAAVMAHTAKIKATVNFTAGPSGFAQVALDGSGSSAIWGSALDTWAWDLRRLDAQQDSDRITAQGSSAVVDVPPGHWVVTLVVGDSRRPLVAGTDTLEIEVAPPPAPPPQAA